MMGNEIIKSVFEFGHTMAELRELRKHNKDAFEEDCCWDFLLEDLLATVFDSPRDDIAYWVIGKRVYEVPMELCKEEN